MIPAVVFGVAVLTYSLIGLAMSIAMLTDSENREDMRANGRWNAKAITVYGFWVICFWPLLFTEEM